MHGEWLKSSMWNKAGNWHQQKWIHESYQDLDHSHRRRNGIPSGSGAPMVEKKKYIYYGEEKCTGSRTELPAEQYRADPCFGECLREVEGDVGEEERRRDEETEAGGVAPQ